MANQTRLNRMVGQAPEYVETSAIYRKIQDVQGDEYDSLDAKNADLKAQLRIRTATWGISYYEEQLHIPIVPDDPLETRRGRILSRWRSPGNFSAALVKTVCESFVNGQVDVSINLATSIVSIRFNGPTGAPERIADVTAALDNIIHAHLDKAYVFPYLSVANVNAKTVAQMNATQLKNFAPFA